ncbi:MAG: carboxypeptidase regulatory-like domain-containing protein [Clostridiales bacterium]|nr:carboxypeptidase regulatory-like domain-containing protein [Clostridiales bacterium]
MEVKKQKWLKIILALSVFAIMIFCTGLNVHAEELKDGILVTMSSDKESYNLEDEVNLKIMLKNTNDFEVSNIKIENILPDGVLLVAGDISKDNINLQANEENTMNLTVKKADSGQAYTTGKIDTSSSNGKIPNTGENNTALIALIVILISIVIMVVCFWKGRKKHLKFLSLFVCLGVVGTLGITGITHAVSDNTQTQTINSSDENISSFTTNFTYVIDNVNYTNKIIINYYTIDFYIFCDTDKKIEEIIDTDIFENSNLEERKEIVLNCLNKLESENRIKKGSIKFNEKYNSYFFKYINGGEGSILLESFSSKDNDDKWKTLNIYYNVDTSYLPSNTYDSNGNASLNNSANGYIKSILSDNNLIQKTNSNNKYEKTALIINEVGDNVRKEYDNQKQIWSSNGLKTSIKQNVTVEEFKTLLLGYDFIEIIGHGYIDYDGNPNICLQENQSFSDMAINGGIKYYDDIKSGRVGRIKGKYGGNFYLTSKFFSDYYENKLSDTIVWISSCEGYSNDTLVSAFANKCDAKSVIGSTDVVYANYNTDMVDIFVHKLLFGLPVDEALKESKLYYGENDEEYRLNPNFGDGQSENTPAEFKNYNGGNETLVELVTVEKYGTLSGIVIDEAGNPVKNAEVLAITVRGGTHKAITDDNGQFIINDCPVDSYRIEVSADGYELYQSDEFLSTDYVVIEGQESKSVTIKLKKTNIENTEIKWQDVYVSYLRNAEYTSLSTGFDNQYITRDQAKFHLVYLDNDEIPELLITGGYSVHIITLVDGKATVVTDENENDNFSWYGNFYYRDFTGYFVSDYERAGTYLTPIYQLNNGKADLQVNIEYDEFFANGNIQKKFLINNNEVSEQEYTNTCNDWNLSTYYYNCPNDNWQRLDLSQYGSNVTEENIKSFIENNPN